MINRELVEIDKKLENFNNTVAVYKNAGLELIKIENDDLERIKNGDKELIKKVLNLNTFIF